MTEILNYLRQLNTASLVLRLSLAMLCGGIIGFERERKRLPAGFRTYMLVCLGAAGTMLLSQYESLMLSTQWNSLAEQIGIRTDVSRFGAQVINGIGFLAAGTILVTAHQQVRGLTTAAGLWASACMGLAIGAGFYECVIVALPLIYLCMRVFPLVDNAIQERTREVTLYIEFEAFDQIGVILNLFKANHVKVQDVQVIHRRENPAHHASAFFDLYLSPNQTHAQIISSLAALEHIYTIEET